MTRRRNKSNNDNLSNMKVIPIGGLNEIGKNFTLLEYEDQILIIDCGMSFPEDEMLGIDIVIPDFSYLIANREKLVGMLITHGHEDHIGAIPYFLRDIKVPIYGTRLTLGLIKNKLEEHNVVADLRTIEAGQKLKIGDFDIEIIRTTHSIADSVCYYIETKAGSVFHSGDFKIDYTPVDGEPIDFSKLAELGKRGVTLMLCDSTNALRPGFSQSEAKVGETIGEIFKKVDKRIIIATFSSNIHRLQKIIDNAIKVGRVVAVSGRSMEKVVELAIELGYLTVPDGTFVSLNEAKLIPDNKIVIITTGSQGEPMSALTRIAAGEHKSVKIKKGDVVVLSSTPIPGNENAVSKVVNKLFSEGAEVIYSDIAETHVSGHASEEELKLLHSLIKPKFFMPVHGELRHLIQHKAIAKSLGMNEENIFILKNGQKLEFNKNEAFISNETVPADAILVDGLGVGDVGNVVLRDRKMLAESGLILICAAISKELGIVVSGPEIISRGFVYVKENEELMEEARRVVSETILNCTNNGMNDWQGIKSKVKSNLSQYIYDVTKRSPIILPVFLEV